MFTLRPHLLEFIANMLTDRHKDRRADRHTQPTERKASHTLYACPCLKRMSDVSKP